MVNLSIVDPEHQFPLLVEAEPGQGPEDLKAWCQEQQDWIDSKLLEHGALLFRGFGISEPKIFERFSHEISGDLLDYVDGNSPRTNQGSGVYTSTEYPPEFFISLHNELSYAPRWPMRIFFCCIVPAEKGGETPLADSRALLSGLDPELVETFRRRQVRYIRNLHGGKGFGRSWQETFQNEDRGQVESYARASGMAVEWKKNGGLRLTGVHPATAHHPTTGEEVWFNQADQFHPSTHPPEVYESMKTFYEGREDELPQHATFGDGGEIDPEMLAEVREITRQKMVLFPWQQGDLLMADNMLVSHGRMPFEGSRKILVSMTGGGQQAGHAEPS